MNTFDPKFGSIPIPRIYILDNLEMISSIYETIFVVSYLEMLYILNFWDDNLISGKVDEDNADDADDDNDDD